MCVPICFFKERFYAFRSDDAADISSDGSRFTVNFGTRDPSWADVKSAKISAVRSTIWWTVPNLEDTSLFLTFLVPSSDLVNPITVQTDIEVKFAKGLYGYGALNTLISDALRLRNVPTSAFTLYADYATQKIQLRFGRPGYVRQGSVQLAEMLGFKHPQATAAAPSDLAQQTSVEQGEAPERQDSTSVYRCAIPGWTSPEASSGRVYAPYPARFDRIQYFNLWSNLVDGGFYGNNGQAKGVIAQVLIDRLVGEQIVYDPNIPIEHHTQAFSRGNWPTKGEFQLLDDKFRPCDTNGQSWTITVRIQQVA